MKRAIFKIGKEVHIYSSTDTEAFSTDINVDEWRQDETAHWEFDLEDADVSDNPGTSITVRRLNEGVTTAFQDTVFINSLKRTIGRDYTFFLAKDFEVVLNGQQILGFEFRVRESTEFLPVRRSYLDPDGIRVEIIAGMAGLPPDDISPDQRLPEREYYGWFVVCNDRVVLAADKGPATVWTEEDKLNWHPQYNGFLGIVRFYSSDPGLLPWDTTKRNVDQENPVYRRAVTKMKEVTRQWVRYTNERRQDLGRARKLEEAAVARPISDIRIRENLVLPSIPKTPRVRMANIHYQRPKEEVLRAARALGNGALSYRDVGIRTFEYFMENEVTDPE
jgi:hypothetical protein